MRNEILKSTLFDDWLRNVSDRRARARINARLGAAEVGNFGDCKPLGGGLSEMRIDYGPGYRVYFGRIGRFIYLILAGGVKGTQRRDIARAKEIWHDET